MNAKIQSVLAIPLLVFTPYILAQTTSLENSPTTDSLILSVNQMDSITAGQGNLQTFLEGFGDIRRGGALIIEGNQDIGHGSVTEGRHDIRVGLRLVNEGNHDLRQAVGGN